jgi:primosomal protein N' (replication factor Y)
MEEILVNIAIPGAPKKFFTYRWPVEMGKLPSPGQRCLVPFGKRKLIGYFISAEATAPPAGLKAVLALPETDSLFNREIFEFLQWISEYYLANIGDVLNAALPPELRKIRKPSYQPGPGFKKEGLPDLIPASLLDIINKKGLIDSRRASLIEKKHPGLIADLMAKGLLRASFINFQKAGPDDLVGQKYNYIKIRPEVAAIVPNEEQTRATRSIIAAFERFSPSLLYGITGSGKTLVYCHLTAEALRRSKTVLVMVPEIALAGTLLSYFRSFFKDEIALLHSALTPKERLNVWQEIKNGRYRIVIGARSAVFAPLKNLGMIIVDEEHDESYKQDDPSPRFQGRDAAVMRAKMADIPVVLGSATPSFESHYNALNGRYQLLKLTRRPETTELPLVRLLDLKEERPTGDNLFFTKTLTSKINQSLKKDNQVILFLNRRGFSPRIKCTDCGHTPVCPHCQLHLTYHRIGNRLMCHFCGYIDSQYDTCTACGGGNFLYIGTGTQKVEEKIGEIFPDARMIRLDSDSAAGRERAHIILSDFAAGKYNMLLGTQMVAKGIDFPRVSLVGVLMADIGIDMPDFRASEKLFAKLIQVAGRSGRGIIPGEVIIQTFNPESDLIDDAARQDYDTFYDREIKSRRNLEYPPFGHLINFRFSSKKEETVQKYSLSFKSRLAAGIKQNRLKADILGPAPCPLYHLRGVYRRHLFIKTKQVKGLVKFLSEWQTAEPNYALPSKIRLIIDIDPYDMM